MYKFSTATIQHQTTTNRQRPFPPISPLRQCPPPGIARGLSQLQILDRRGVLDEVRLGVGGAHEHEAEWHVVVAAAGAGGEGYEGIAGLGGDGVGLADLEGERWDVREGRRRVEGRG